MKKLILAFLAVALLSATYAFAGGVLPHTVKGVVFYLEK